MSLDTPVVANSSKFLLKDYWISRLSKRQQQNTTRRVGKQSTEKLNPKSVP